MIGMSRVLSRSLIRRAVSIPSMPGMRTSSRISMKSSCRSCLSAWSPEVTATRFWPRGSRIASSATRFSGRSSTMRMLALIRGEVRSSVLYDHALAQPYQLVRDRAQRQDARGGDGVERGLRHLRPLGALRVLHDRGASVRGDAGEAGRAVLVRAREHDADDAGAVAVARRLEELVDRGPR